jgi:hypothetical protein
MDAPNIKTTAATALNILAHMKSPNECTDEPDLIAIKACGLCPNFERELATFAAICGQLVVMCRDVGARRAETLAEIQISTGEGRPAGTAHRMCALECNAFFLSAIPTA